MTIKIRTVRVMTNVTRVWFGCADCGMYGNTSVDHTWRPADFVAHLNSTHRCLRGES